jgi:hypothetical protein
VEDFLFDDQTWIVQYLVVDTSNWIGGKTVLVSTDVISRIDPVEQRIDLSISRDQVRAGPSLDAADIPLAERLPTIWIM